MKESPSQALSSRTLGVAPTPTVGYATTQVSWRVNDMGRASFTCVDGDRSARLPQAVRVLLGRARGKTVISSAGTCGRAAARSYFFS